MGRYAGNQNVTSFKYESGTYANVSGSVQWIGLVQNFTSDDTENVQEIRYHGTNSRSVAKSLPGAENFGGTIDFYPQDMRFLFFGLGNGSDSGTGSPAYYSHVVTELNSATQSPVVSGTRNPFTSFSIESIQQFNPTGLNFIRTYIGCNVEKFSLSKRDNSLPLMCSFTFIAQTRTFNSGAGYAAPTENTDMPYLPYMALVHVPSGTMLDYKTFDFSFTNKMDRDNAHVGNGSRVIVPPVATERDYTFTFTVDGDSSQAARLYGLYVSGGLTSVNAAIQLNKFGNTASGVSFITMSGCDIVGFDAPNPIEGVNEWSLTLTPHVVDGLMQDDVVKYLPW